MNNLKALGLVSAIALASVLGNPSWSQDSTDLSGMEAGRDQVEATVEDSTTDALAERRTKLIDEAVSALAQTREAIKALDAGDKQAAIDALAQATGKLETIVARSPDLALAPVAVDYATIDLLASPQRIRDIGNRVEDLVEDGEFQAARALLGTFASEIVVSTTSLPLATYPDAILDATALIEQDKMDDALLVLNTALSTQVVTERVIPLPPLRAEAMISSAEALLEAGDVATADDAGLTAGDYVNAARVELEVGEAMGYGTEDDFEELHDTIDELDEAIDQATDTGGIFDRIDDGFGRLKERLFNRNSDT